MDLDKTAMRSRTVPIRPSTPSDTEHSVNVLPPGTHLGEFEIVELIGEGGFGIVYLAHDHSLERRVALKEYMPSGLATRTTRMAVTVRSQQNRETFTVGLKSFINEARMLAQFDSPALVKVHSFWEGNGTAYMVMPFYEGVTVKQALKQHQIKPTEEWIRVMLADLFDAIEIIHRAHCLHRDIAPDNILLLKDGRPLLLDFGAARRVIGDLTQCLTAILKPGFAPIEQYADIAGLRQGAWTDIYALAAVVYYLIASKAPPPAVARMVHDEMVPAVELGRGRYSGNFLRAVDKALAVKPEQRFQSIADMRAALDIMGTAPRTLPEVSADWATTMVRTDPLPQAAPPTPPTPPAPRKPAVPPPMPDATQTILAGTLPAGQLGAAKPQPAPQGASFAEPGRVPPRTTRTEPAAPAHARSARTAPAAGTVRIEPTIAQASHHGEQGAPSPSGIPRSHIPAAARDRFQWPIIALLLAAGITAGVYVGTNRNWDGVSADSQPSASGQIGQGSAGHSQPAGAAGGDTASEPSLASEGVSVPAAPAAGKQNADAASELPSEIEAWRAAGATGTLAAYQRYLEQYPNGRYASIARLRMERLQPKPEPPAPAAEPPLAKAVKPEAKPKAAASISQPSAQTSTAQPAPSAEEAAWTRATTLDTVPAYQHYLRNFPKGGYAALARDRIAGMKAGQAAPSVAAPQPDSAPQQPAKQASLAPQTPPAAPPASAPGTPGSQSAQASPSEPPATAPSTPSPEQAATSAANAPQMGQSAKSSQTPQPATAADEAAETIPVARPAIRFSDHTISGDFSVDPRSGLISGRVNIVWTNGDRFSGTMAQGAKTGRGRFVWSNGQSYTGDWANDAPNGRGKFVFTDGSRYEGGVKDGVQHGFGTLWFANGSNYRGQWIAGKSHGQGRLTWSDGRYWEGEFRDDKRTDNGQMVYPDGGGRSIAQSPAERSSGE